MCIKNLFLRYLLTFIGLTIGPLICGPLILAFGSIIFPFYPFYQLILIMDKYRCCRQSSCLGACYMGFTLFILLYPLLIVLNSLLAAFLIAAASISLCLYYIVLLILLIRMPFIHCCKPSESSNRELENI